MAALFSLGVFNPYTFSPKASPGSCQVVRSGGYVALIGTCTGQIPQSVASFYQGNITIKDNPQLRLKIMTLVVWVAVSIYPTGNGNTMRGSIISKISFCALSTTDFPYTLEVTNSGDVLYAISGGKSFSDASNIYSKKINLQKWYQVIGTFNGLSQKIYVDGNQVSSATYNELLSTNFEPLKFGSVAYFNGPSCGGQNWFKGKISNVQIYNTSLSGADIEALYKEGIGGAPINLRNLVGWWPLNGNAKDYSGNGNNGNVIGNVIFTTNWYNGYTAP